MSKSIKLNNNTYIDSTGITHDRTNLKDILDLRGCCAVFYKDNSTQHLPANTSTTIQFNATQYVDNGCFSLNSDGTIKVLKNISRVFVSVNCRIINNGRGGILYVNGNNGGFNCELSSNTNAINSYNYNCSGVLEVSQNSNITVSFYPAENDGSAFGYNRNWFGITITVLK